jgi:hypothetical protein
MRKHHLIALAVILALISGTAARAEGNLAADATRLPELSLDSTALSMSQTEYDLETGKYYRWRITSDGGEEFQVIAPNLFRNAWINQVVINDLEVKPLGLSSVEFDDAGSIDIWFVPIRPGRYDFGVAGYENRGMAGVFNVK